MQKNPHNIARMKLEYYFYKVCIHYSKLTFLYFLLFSLNYKICNGSLHFTQMYVKGNIPSLGFRASK